jgi:hypothetical protein
VIVRKLVILPNGVLRYTIGGNKMAMRIFATTIKVFIVIWFILTILHFVVFGFLLMSYDFDVDFLKIDRCIDLGMGGWDYEQGLCRLGLK